MIYLKLRMRQIKKRFTGVRTEQISFISWIVNFYFFATVLTGKLAKNWTTGTTSAECYCFHKPSGNVEKSVHRGISAP